MAHPKVSKAIKTRPRAIYRTLDPVALLAEMRAAQDALGTRIDARAGKTRVVSKVTIGETATVAPTVQSGTATFAKALGTTIEAGEPRATHRKPKRRYKTRVRMPSMLDPHVATIEGWLAAEPPLTALTILGRLIEGHPDQFGPKQESIVQRLLRTLRTQAAQRIIAAEPVAATPDHVERPSPRPPGTVDGSGWAGPDHSPSTCPSPRAISRRHVTQARVTFSDEAIRGSKLHAGSHALDPIRKLPVFQVVEVDFSTTAEMAVWSKSPKDNRPARDRVSEARAASGTSVANRLIESLPTPESHGARRTGG